MITIKESTDHEVIADLNREVQALHHAMYPEVFKPFDREAIRSALQRILGQENTKAFVASCDAKPAGYVVLMIIDHKENAYIHGYTTVLVDQIAVLKDFHGKGIGKQLIERAIKFAQEKKIKRMDLNHWSMNDRARSFFEDAGFMKFNEKMWRQV
jgi:GNAT superfamily N-acetyltransferase